MRIALVNWAKVWEGPAVGGGVNGYAQSLALALHARGHEVAWLSSGTRYDAPPRLFSPSKPGPARVERLPDWLGIRADEIVNSPVLAPSLLQFRDPAGEISAPLLEAVVARWAADLKPDVVHWHNIEGFSAGCIAAIRRGHPPARIAFSLHNYHTICPQVYLMQGHRRPCVDFKGGEACTNCVPAVDPAVERQRRAGEAAAPGSPWRQALRILALGPPAIEATPPKFAGEQRGNSPEILASTKPHPWSPAGLSIPALKPLSNSIVPTPGDREASNDYGRRRAAMLAALSACDVALPVSKFVHDKFVSLGLDPARARTLHIGSRLPEILARRPEALLPPGLTSDLIDGRRPLRVAFMGYNNWYKGLQMLFDSVEMLAPEVAARLHVSILALGGEQMENLWRRLEPRLAGLRLVHGYKYDDIPWLLTGTDVGIVPSVWWDNGPQTVIEYLACGVPVVGARLGGIPDFVDHGRNGLLFEGNNRCDLARTLASIVAEPRILDTLRAGARGTRIKTMAEHAAELEGLYALARP